MPAPSDQWDGTKINSPRIARIKEAEGFASVYSYPRYPRFISLAMRFRLKRLLHLHSLILLLIHPLQPLVLLLLNLVVSPPQVIEQVTFSIGGRLVSPRWFRGTFDVRRRRFRRPELGLAAEERIAV